MPYLQLFFMSKLFAAVTRRKKYFKDMLSVDSTVGVFACFQRVGLKNKNLFDRNITYRMVEKVVSEMRAVYPVRSPAMYNRIRIRLALIKLRIY